MNRDLLNNADPRRVAQAAMTVVDRLQDYQPHEQMLGATTVFLALAEHWGIPAKDLFSITTNLINNQSGKRPEFGAVQLYIEQELAKR